VDALLASLDRLIAKKRDIKQAAMQQLLTGKQRLPGFGTAKAGYKQAEEGLLPRDWDTIVQDPFQPLSRKVPHQQLMGLSGKATGYSF
jgi:hypothetical protein